MSASTARASTSPITEPIKLERQAKAARRVLAAASAIAELTTRMSRPRCDSRTSAKAVIAEESLLVIFGAGVPRRSSSKRLVAWGLTRGNAQLRLPRRLRQLARRRRHGPAARPAPRLRSGQRLPAPSPGVRRPARHARHSICRRCSTPPRSGKLGALLRRRRQSRRDATASIPRRSRTPSSSCRIMFLTETAALADVVLPAANLYEKSGTVTNTYGDLQLVEEGRRPRRRHARLRDDRPPRRHDGRGRQDARSLRQGRRHAPTWASRAARSPARPTATPSGWPPTTSSRKLSPFDPFAILDEIERLVPGYKLDRPATFRRQRRRDRAGLRAGLIAHRPPRPDLVLPRTTHCSPPAPWAATVRRCANWSFINRSN